MGFVGRKVAVRGLGCVTAVCTFLALFLGGSARSVGGPRSVRGTVATATESVGLTAVACSSPRACTAVGLLAGQPGRPVSERWNGRSWSLQDVGVPRHGSTGDGRPSYGTLSSVSCASRSTCFAVGTYSVERNGPFDVPLVERWAHGAWAVQRTPMPLYGHLERVSCSSPRACTAVGTFGLGPGCTRDRRGLPCQRWPLIERWNGRRWALQRAARANGGDLSAVSCVSKRSCTAVGGFPFDSTSLLAERWDGSSWSRQRIVTPPAGTATALTAVSCTSITACVAVGSYDNQECGEGGCSGASGRLMELWNGSRWSPRADDSHRSWGSVSCVSSSWCVAIHDPGELQRWNGTRWSTQLKVHPRQGNLNYVSCTSTNFCAAIGTRNGGQTMWRWNGRSWSERTIKVPTLPTALAIDTTALPDGSVNQPYTATAHASGGVPPYRWKLIVPSGEPPWLSLGSTGVASGTPPSSGNWFFEINVTDAESPPQVVSAGVSLSVPPNASISSRRPFRHP